MAPSSFHVFLAFGGVLLASTGVPLPPGPHAEHDPVLGTFLDLVSSCELPDLQRAWSMLNVRNPRLVHALSYGRIAVTVEHGTEDQRPRVAPSEASPPTTALVPPVNLMVNLMRHRGECRTAEARDLLSVMLAHGASPNLRLVPPVLGDLPLESAIAARDPVLVDILRRHGARLGDPWGPRAPSRFHFEVQVDHLVSSNSHMLEGQRVLLTQHAPANLTSRQETSQGRGTGLLSSLRRALLDSLTRTYPPERGKGTGNKEDSDEKRQRACGKQCGENEEKGMEGESKQEEKHGHGATWCALTAPIQSHDSLAKMLLIAHQALHQGLVQDVSSVVLALAPAAKGSVDLLSLTRFSQHFQTALNDAFQRRSWPAHTVTRRVLEQADHDMVEATISALFPNPPNGFLPDSASRTGRAAELLASLLCRCDQQGRSVMHHLGATGVISRFARDFIARAKVDGTSARVLHAAMSIRDRLGRTVWHYSVKHHGLCPDVEAGWAEEPTCALLRLWKSCNGQTNKDGTPRPLREPDIFGNTPLEFRSVGHPRGVSRLPSDQRPSCEGCQVDPGKERGARTSWTSPSNFTDAGEDGGENALQGPSRTLKTGNGHAGNTQRERLVPNVGHGASQSKIGSKRQCDFLSVPPAASEAEKVEGLVNAIVTNTPVLLRGIGRSHPLGAAWRSGDFLRQHRAAVVDVASIPVAGSLLVPMRRTTLGEFVREMSGNEKNMAATVGNVTDKAPPYLFVSDASVLGSPSSAEQRFPFLKDEFLSLPLLASIKSVLDNALEVGARQLYLGPPGSGAPWHFHMPAANLLITGEKRWFLVPPEHALYSTEPAVQFLSKGVLKNSTRADDVGKLELNRMERISPLRCPQMPGDMVFVPGSWGHAVLNVQQSLGLAIEFDIPILS